MQLPTSCIALGLIAAINSFNFRDATLYPASWTAIYAVVYSVQRPSVGTRDAT
jgi:hypothetical protein